MGAPCSGSFSPCGTGCPIPVIRLYMTIPVRMLVSINVGAGANDERLIAASGATDGTSPKATVLAYALPVGGARRCIQPVRSSNYSALRGLGTNHEHQEPTHVHARFSIGRPPGLFPRFHTESPRGAGYP